MKTVEAGRDLDPSLTIDDVNATTAARRATLFHKQGLPSSLEQVGVVLVYDVTSWLSMARFVLNLGTLRE